MDRTTTLYAAYGSSMDKKHMAECCPEAKHAGTGVLEGYRLTFRGRWWGTANIEKNEGSSTPVVLWEIKGSNKTAFAPFGGTSGRYRKKQVNVKCGGEEKRAAAYVMAEGYESLAAIPLAGYFRSIEDGYRQNEIGKGALYAALQNTYREACENRLKGL